MFWLLLIRLYKVDDLKHPHPQRAGQGHRAVWPDVLAIQDPKPVVLSTKPAEPAPAQPKLIDRILPGIRPSAPTHLKVAFVNERTPRDQYLDQPA